MNNLSVIIDFIVLNTDDNKVICIGDKSQWGVAENLPAYLLTKIPGANDFITLNFQKERLVFLTSVNLGLTCVTETCSSEQNLQELPDGVWEFCLKSSYEGLDKKRYYLKTDTLRLEIDKIYIKEGLEYNPDSKVVKSLEKVEWLLKVAHSYIREGNNVKAMKAFTLAQEELEKQKNCKNCI
jgi:hypothetical protein